VRKKLLFAVTLLVVLFSAAPSYADTAWIDRPLRKLGRGVANIGFSPFEILIQPYDVAKREGNTAGLFFGLFRGIAWIIARVCVGAVELATFPFPLPGCPDSYSGTEWGYGPIMTPEWVFDINHNWGSFFYEDDSMVRP